MLSPSQILQVASFLDLLAASMIVPQFPNHVRSLGGNHLLIGSMGAVYSATQLLSGPIIGSLSDLRGRKTLLVVTISLSGISYVLLGITSSLALFIGIRAIVGLFKHTQLLTRALAPEYEKDKIQLSIMNGRMDTISGVGMSIGPIVGGHIMDMYPEYGFTIIALIGGALFAVNSALLRRLPEEESTDKKKSKEPNIALIPKITSCVINTFKISIDQFYKVDWKVYREEFLFRLLTSLCIGVYGCNYAIYLKMKHGVTPKTLGYITSFIFAVSSFGTYFIGYINKLYEDDKDFTKRSYHVFLTTTLSLIGMMLAPEVSVYIACIIPFAIGSAVGKAVELDRILSMTNDSQRGTVLGAAGNIRSLTGVVSPMIAGVVGEYIGIFYIIYISIALGAVGSYASYKVRLRSIDEAKIKQE